MRYQQNDKLTTIMRMKRFLLMLAVAAMAIACDAPTTESTQGEPTVIVNSNTNVFFEVEGGKGEISFTIENANKSIELLAESTDAWITIDSIDEVICYTVAANDGYEERTGHITITYGNSLATINIMQHVSDVTVYTALTTFGSEYIAGSNGIHNYYVVLSTVGTTESGLLQPNAEYYYFDIYSSVAATNSSTTAIPNGTYTLSTDGNIRDGIVDYEWSNYTVSTDSDYVEYFYKECSVVVSDGSIVATITLENGDKHIVKYTGSLDIPVYDPNDNGGGDGGDDTTEGLSTLTSDHTFNITDGVFVGAYVGDLLYNGCNTCQVYLFEYLDYETGEERGDQFEIDLQLPQNETDICGTYTAGTTAGHFIPGTAEDMGGQYMQVNSWYMTAGYTAFAPLVGGTVTVEKDDADIYTFTIDTVDDKGNRIYGTFKGQGKFTEW